MPEPDGRDVSIAPRLLITGWILYGVATVTTSTRIIAKSKLNMRLDLDDAFLILALILGIANLAFDTTAVHFGLGRHFVYLSPSERVNAMKYEFLAEPVGILSLTFARLSVIVYLLQLIVISKAKKRFMYILGALQFLTNIATIIVTMSQCSHIATLWDPLGTPGTCWSPDVQVDISYFQGAANAFTDFALTVMPATIICTLPLAMHLRVGLCVLLGLSSLAMVAAIMKTTLVSRLADRSDFTYQTVDFVLWGTVERCTIIITSSIPTLRSLFVRPKLNNSSYQMHSLDSNENDANLISRPQSISARYFGAVCCEENVLPPLKTVMSKIPECGVGFEKEGVKIAC